MATIHDVNPETLIQWLNSNDAVLVDVRETNEHQSERIEGSRNIPLSGITLNDAYLPEHKDKKLVIHCLAGGRSAMACQKLIGDGSNADIWNLEGGISAWKSAGLEVISK